MHRWMMAVSLALVGGCGDKDDDTGVSEADADTDTDTDSDTDADTDSDTDTDHDLGEIKTPGEAVFDAVIDGSEFVGEPGYWTGNASTSSLLAVQSEGEVQLRIDVVGDVHGAGEFVVDKVAWVDTIDSSSWDFYYQGNGDGVQVLVVDAHDETGDYLWAAFEGSITLTDGVSGGEVEFTALTVESWRRFGAK